ncbi:MAG TPA: carboxypeptidase-like regulatory domain-containing protein, partial [Gemmataceae bacterium]|nr:carboxypeptidase-like regulatory domain-containing protein [Gemmataceae bacterium]
VDLKSGDSKGAETNKKGEFVFTDLAPGKYRLSAEKSASRTKGEEIVQVKEGEQKTGVTIKLKRQ